MWSSYTVIHANFIRSSIRSTWASSRRPSPGWSTGKYFPYFDHHWNWKWFIFLFLGDVYPIWTLSSTSASWVSSTGPTWWTWSTCLFLPIHVLRILQQCKALTHVNISILDYFKGQLPFYNLCTCIRGKLKGARPPWTCSASSSLRWSGSKFLFLFLG